MYDKNKILQSIHVLFHSDFGMWAQASSNMMAFQKCTLYILIQHVNPEKN